MINIICFFYEVDSRNTAKVHLYFEASKRRSTSIANKKYHITSKSSRITINHSSSCNFIYCNSHTQYLGFRIYTKDNMALL